MTTTWLDEVFNVRKPVIAMLHLAALPGDPEYDTAGGITAVVNRAREELDALQSGGVDGILISNEFSLPYLTKTEPITAITMARIIGE
ncbi:MAG: BtpA/SgcQ family protein, partial [Mycobacterium sp.]